MTQKLLFLSFLIGGLVLMAVKRAKMHVTGIYDSAINKMAYAIKTWEDWVLPGGFARDGTYLAEGSVSYRNNNPGNLKFRGQAKAIGADIQGHAKFGSYDDGWAALIYQLQLAFYGGSVVYSLRTTISGFFHLYAEDNSDSYAQFVASQLGVSASTHLQDLQGV